MIISDLSYLEVVAEASAVVGGKKKNREQKIKLPKTLIGDLNLTQQTNVAVVTQVANATSAAVSKDGDATSEATAVNNLEINQANVAG